jgi:hypothetical protein
MLKMQFTIEMVMILMVIDYGLEYFPLFFLPPRGTLSNDYMNFLVKICYRRLNLHMVDGEVHHQ